MLVLVNTERVGVVPAKVVQLLDDGSIVIDWYNGTSGKFNTTSAVYPVARRCTLGNLLSNKRWMHVGRSYEQSKLCDQVLTWNARRESITYPRLHSSS
jgi:hypothetical protein